MEEKASLGFKWLYGVNAFGNGLLGGFVSSYIMIFFSDVTLVPVAFIGSLFFAIKILNMCVAPGDGRRHRPHEQPLGQNKALAAGRHAPDAADRRFNVHEYRIYRGAAVSYVSIVYVMWGFVQYRIRHGSGFGVPDINAQCRREAQTFRHSGDRRSAGGFHDRWRRIAADRGHCRHPSARLFTVGASIRRLIFRQQSILH